MHCRRRGSPPLAGTCVCRRHGVLACAAAVSYLQRVSPSLASSYAHEELMLSGVAQIGGIRLCSDIGIGFEVLLPLSLHCVCLAGVHFAAAPLALIGSRSSGLALGPVALPLQQKLCGVVVGTALVLGDCNKKEIRAWQLRRFLSNRSCFDALAASFALGGI